MNKNATPEHLVQMAVVVHSATSAIILSLVETLSNAGVIATKDFEENLRNSAERMARENLDVASIMFDFAELLDPENKSH